MASDGESQSEESDRSCAENIGSTSEIESSHSEVDSSSDVSEVAEENSIARNREINDIEIEDIETNDRGDDNIDDNLYDVVEEFSEDNDPEIEMDDNNDDIDGDDDDGDRNDDNDDDGDDLIDAEDANELDEYLNDNDQIYADVEEIGALQFLNESDYVNPRLTLMGGMARNIC